MEVILSIVPAIIALLLGCDGVEDSRLLGCYSPTSLFTADHTLVHPLTWEICARLCVNQATRYVGVQANKHLCHCFNDPIMIDNLLMSTDCKPCHENNTQFCGGENALSVYELAGPQSEVLLVATPNGVMLLKDTKMIPIEGLTLNATTVDFDYNRQSIFYSSKRKLLRSTYIPHLMRYYLPTTIFENEHEITDFAVDWLDEKIYMTFLDLSAYYKINLNGTALGRIISQISESEDMAIDPYNRILFAKYKSNLLSYNFSEFNSDMIGKYMFKKTKSVAVDIHEETVYVIGAYESAGAWYVAAVDYNCTHFRVLHSGRTLTDPFGLEVFNSHLYWVNRKGSLHTVYRAEIGTRGHLQNVTVVYEGTQKINRIKIFHPDAQTPSKSYICKLKNCSQECVVLSYRIAKCTCSGGMALADDGITCVTKSFPPPSDPGSTMAWSHTLSSAPWDQSPVTEDVSSSSDLFSETSISTSEDRVPTTTAVTTPSEGHQFVSSSPALPINFICDLVIICFLLVILVIGVRQHTQIRNITMFYNRSTDLTELTFND